MALTPPERASAGTIVSCTDGSASGWPLVHEVSGRSLLTPRRLALDAGGQYVRASGPRWSGAGVIALGNRARDPLSGGRRR